MDIADWGEAQHLLHGRVAPMRAAEYAVPIFRVCSSGVSQFVDGTGRVLSSAPFPGDGAMLAAEIPLPGHGRMPPDRWLARLSVAVVAALIGWLGGEAIWQRCVVKPVPVLNLSDNSPSMNYLETSSPRPSPPQGCGGEGEEARGARVACAPRRAGDCPPYLAGLLGSDRLP